MMLKMMMMMMMVMVMMMMMVMVMMMMLAQVMHEFVCCQEDPAQPLSSREVCAPRGGLLHAAAFLAACPRDCGGRGLRARAKGSATLLDAFTAAGAAAATRASRGWREAVDMDTLLLM